MDGKEHIDSQSIELADQLHEQAPELILGDEIGGDTTQGSHSMHETLTSIKESRDDSEPKLCKETDIYALGMVSVYCIIIDCRNRK